VARIDQTDQHRCFVFQHIQCWGLQRMQCLCFWTVHGLIVQQHCVLNAYPANTVSPPLSSWWNNCTCIPGYTGPDGSACTACAAGSYKTLGGSAACTTCVLLIRIAPWPQPRPHRARSPTPTRPPALSRQPSACAMLATSAPPATAAPSTPWPKTARAVPTPHAVPRTGTQLLAQSRPPTA
jgi:hypothetical protein